VDHATVSRRVRALEDALGVRLFERLPGGWETTPAGEVMMRAAGRIEDEAQALEREIRGDDRRLAGPFRMTISENLLQLVAPDLARFAVAHPDIEFELVTNVQRLDLTRREADVAIRITSAPPEHHVGRRIGPVCPTVYGSVDYLDGNPDLPLNAHRWIDWDTSLVSQQSSSQRLRADVPGAFMRCRVSTMSAFLEATLAGLGLAHLTCFTGDPHPRLRRLMERPPVLNGAIWILTHADRTRSARERALSAFMKSSPLRLLHEARSLRRRSDRGGPGGCA